MKIVSSLTLVTLLSIAATTACGGDPQSQPGPQDTPGFQDAVLLLKQQHPADYDAKLAQLKLAYGIPASNEAPIYSEPVAPKAAGGESLGSTVQALSNGTEVYSTTYSVQRTYIEEMRLEAGQTLDWYTTEATPNTDPVMVLFQYERTNGFCAVEPTAMPKLRIVAYNDDSAGTQSRIRYTVPSSGCYALVIYAYSPSSAGAVRLTKDGCAAPRPPTCSGQNPTICLAPGPVACVVTTGNWGPTIPATGVAVRGIAMDFMATSNATGGADPWLFAFNFSDATGASNDDTSGPDSSIDRTDFRVTATYPNTVLLAGFNSSGTATFKGYRR